MQLPKKYAFPALKAIFILLAVIILIFIFRIPINKNLKRQKNVLLVEYKEPENINEIRTINSKNVTPVIFEQIPYLGSLDPDERKNKYVEIILPTVLIVKYELYKERKRTLDIWGELKSNQYVSSEDSLFMEKLFAKYNTKNFAEIHQRQQVHPNSIILAQSAIETGWGQSRFFIQGNNAFGIWSYSKLDDRIETISTRNEVKIYVKKYENILESTRDYFTTVARSWAFDEFRKKRAETDNPYELIWYLNKYSELRNDYVKKLGEVMVQNNLTKYDSCELNPDYFVKVRK